MGDKVEARAIHHCAATPERVYDAWIDSDKVRLWMAAALRDMGLSGEMKQVDIDPRVGGRFLFSDMRNGMEARHWGTYLALARPLKIVFTWIVDEKDEADPSTVTLTIVPNGDGCVTSIAHEMDAKWAEYVERTETGWTRMLHAIDELLSK